MRRGLCAQVVLVLVVALAVLLTGCSGSDAGHTAQTSSSFARWNTAFGGGDREQLCNSVDPAFLRDAGYGADNHPSVAGPQDDKSTPGSRLVSCQWNGTAPQQITLGAQQYSSAASLQRTVAASRKKIASAKSTASAHINELRATAHGLRASETDQGTSGSVNIDSCSQWQGKRQLYIVVTSVKDIALNRVCDVLAAAFDRLAK